ncbi:dienelactone hydrolase family protein [Clavibacter michiganensis]|uniref:Lipase n=3 Tax=Clavibacter michiganensis TaxID=28447 RepID=A0A0D5CMG7_9MICO|nr:dienelactone hydrolase family protein [Clavibacter michiganensis]AJW80497.1 lipase [Clavibacter michiganensis subsp. insidiosus]OQJ61278.1 lipase [Clavibacter michiganensis subsp. insidiosus]RII87188.1 lipase [Clavibacter michiganensis subsp. insidiosus]RMC85081.1 lipase [Clavibacter michiganensis subsp. insidiosus]
MSVMPSSLRRPAAVAALALVATLAAPAAAQAHAPAPQPVVVHHHAPFAVRTTVVPKTAVKAFGGGVIYTPQDTGKPVLGAVVITPGFTNTNADEKELGQLVASQGFVAFVIDTLDTGDLPAQRATEILAATDYLTGQSAVRSEVSAKDVGLIGYSFGGGGTMQAAQSRPSIKAAIGLMPFDVPPASDPHALYATYPKLTTPTLVITGQKDEVARPKDFGKPAYDSIPAGTPKQYLELKGLDHSAGEHAPVAAIRNAVTAFLKRYLDGNSAYAKFICPAPKVGGPISVSLSSCPKG